MWVDEPIESHMGYVASVIGREFAETDVRRGFVNGFQFNCLTGTSSAGEAAAGWVTDTKAPWGRDHHAWFERHFGHGIGIHAIGDDLPNPRTASRSTPPPATATAFRRPAALRARRERSAHDELHARSPGRHRRGGRRLRGEAHRLSRPGRRLPHAGLAHDRHLPHGRGRRLLGGQQMEPELGRAEPLHRRRQRSGDGRRRQPDADDLGPGAAGRRLHPRQLRPAERDDALRSAA